MSDYFSTTGRAYIAALGAWAAFGLGYVLGGPFGWVIACLLAIATLVLALRAVRDGEAGMATAAGPILAAAVLLFFAVPQGYLVVLAVVAIGSWLVSRAVPAAGRRELPVSTTTIAYVLGGCAWGLVGLFFIVTSPDEEAPQGCDLLDCFGGVGDELFWYMVLFPPFVLLSLGGAAIAARALWACGWSRADLGALALSASGPALYAGLALAYG